MGRVIRICGLVLNLIGSACAGFAGYYGLAAGWGGQMVPVSTGWQWSWPVGWVLIIIGFGLQVVGEFAGDRRGLHRNS